MMKNVIFAAAIFAVGCSGTVGIAGKNGTDGTPGVDGTNGTNGIDGKNGTNGADGKNGIDGTNGVDGATGTTGAAGTNGMNGIDGVAGAVGPKGDTGLTGATGAIGMTGATGPAGTNGSDKTLSDQNGSRLKVVTMSGTDGSSTFYSYWDNVLTTMCSFRVVAPWSGNQNNGQDVRCVPDQSFGIPFKVAYLDTMCSIPVVYYMRPESPYDMNHFGWDYVYTNSNPVLTGEGTPYVNLVLKIGAPMGMPTTMYIQDNPINGSVGCNAVNTSDYLSGAMMTFNKTTIVPLDSMIAGTFTLSK
jgi:hypothetical protein